MPTYRYTYEHASIHMHVRSRPCRAAARGDRPGLRTCMHAYMYACMPTDIYTHTYVRMYLYMCVCIDVYAEIFRPAHAAARLGARPTLPVVQHAIETLSRTATPFSEICCIYPTAALLTHELLQKGLKQLESTGADYVIPVTRFHTR